MDQASGMGQGSNDLAQERTRLAKDRTFAAIIRTVLSFIGFGIGIVKLFPDLDPPWVAQTLGILLILGGGLLSLSGFRTVHDVITKLRAQGLEEPRWIITMTTLLLLITAIMGLLVVAAT